LSQIGGELRFAKTAAPVYDDDDIKALLLNVMEGPIASPTPSTIPIPDPIESERVNASSSVLTALETQRSVVSGQWTVDRGGNLSLFPKISRMTFQMNDSN